MSSNTLQMGISSMMLVAVLIDYSHTCSSKVEHMASSIFAIGSSIADI